VRSIRITSFSKVSNLDGRLKPSLQVNSGGVMGKKDKAARLKSQGCRVPFSSCCAATKMVHTD
ncbi:MAG: hypothetical protein QNJ61_16855, partial [Desulfobacterales bacterium]|nr:hypothetical protein [Desulfobacterales bacterium]